MTTSTTQFPQINDLETDIVPHDQWATTRWFYANPVWSYHRPATDAEIAASRHSYELIDPELRELCELLAARGLRTTPSCQGHFHSRERLERIWGELTWEAEFIRSVGLVVKDVETQADFLFKRSEYRLPWATFDQFAWCFGEQQSIGHVGILLPADAADLTDLLKSVQCDTGALRMYFDDAQTARKLGAANLFTIVTRPATPIDRARAWQSVTGQFRQVLSRVAPSTSTNASARVTVGA